MRILHQPRPPTPLNARARRIHLLLELLYAPITLVNRLTQRATRRLPPTLILRGQVLPEEGVVDVAAAVEVYEREEGLDGGDAVGGGGGG